MGRLLEAAAAATLLLSASTAFAAGSIEGPGGDLEGPGDCESSPDGCGPHGPPTPSKPTLPAAISYSGSYRLSRSNVDGQVYYKQDTPYLTTIGGGVGVPLGEVLHTDSNATQSVSLQETNMPGAVSVSATNSDLGYATAGLGQGQLIIIHTASAAAAQALFALQAGGASLATVQGYFTVDATGYGRANGQASTGFSFLDAGNQQSIVGNCDPSNRYNIVSVCGRTDYSLSSYFVTGDTFEDGDAADLIGVFGLSGYAEAGFGPFVGPGTATAYVDPNVVFSQDVIDQRRQGLLTTSVGGVDQTDPTSAAPEPASWMMMLIGFGAIGSAIRHRRRDTKTALA